MVLVSALWWPVTGPEGMHGAVIGEVAEIVSGHCKRFHREMVTALSLSEIKKHLDYGLRHMIYFCVVLCGCRSWTC